MDTLRGTFGSDSSADRSWEESEDDGAEPARVRDLPPHAIGQDERRMQVRAYNHWASLLGEHSFPNIEDLDPAALPDFGPHSVLLDFSFGIDNPVVRFLGEKLAHECHTHGAVITRLSDVPPRSLLSRITDHYMQILANQAPIGFEAEFVGTRGHNTMYRGILLPFSSDGATIDFIYGVINWKEIVGEAEQAQLAEELAAAVRSAPPRRSGPRALKRPGSSRSRMVAGSGRAARAPRDPFASRQPPTIRGSSSVWQDRWLRPCSNPAKAMQNAASCWKDFRWRASRSRTCLPPGALKAPHFAL